MSFASPEFWIALLQIIGVNIVLSGDNAVVIALAARGLPPDQQKRAVAWGSGAAVVMRIALTIVAVELLRLPYLKLVGCLLLLWIAVQLLLPEDEGEGGAKTVGSLASAIKTILIADLVMSLDNVIAVAAAAKGNTALLVIGLAVSIPLVVFASRLLLTLMERFPVIITIGAALLGWVAGEMAISDPILRDWVNTNAAFLHYAAPAAGALLVLAIGKLMASRKAPHAGLPAQPAGAHAVGRLKRVLLAVDGSEGSAQAVRQVIALRNDLSDPQRLGLHVVNVQRPVPGTSFVASQAVHEYHQERGEEALAPARAMLTSAGIQFEEHRRVGEPGAVIAELAQAHGCDLIVMGASGRGTHGAALPGSVARSTVSFAAVPVLMAK